MPTEKTLVIGSTKHQHVRCVSWREVPSINIPDFDIIVVNVRSLTIPLLKSLRADFFQDVRRLFVRLLVSGGEIIVLGDKYRSVQISKYSIHENYSWSPIPIGVHEESGDTLVPAATEFPKYLSRFKKWDFYYFLPKSGGLPRELTQLVGDIAQYEYAVRMNPIILNRYGMMLCCEIGCMVTPRVSGTPRALGAIFLLPLIDDLDDREAVNLVLEDLLSLPQSTLPPEWVEAVPMPLVSGIQKVIDEKIAAIDALDAEIAAEEERKASIEQFRKLLYSSGTELEEIFAACLEKCGGEVTPAKYSQEEFVLTHKGALYLIECKGVSKSIKLEHVRQLFDYMTKFEEDEQQPGKGILLGNAWKDVPLNLRSQAEDPIFPDNVVRRSNDLKIALVSSVDFFHAFCRFLAGEVTGEAILDRITTAVGVVDFQNL